jgi:hypothetical protein
LLECWNIGMLGLSDYSLFKIVVLIRERRFSAFTPHRSAKASLRARHSIIPLFHNSTGIQIHPL